MSKITMLSRTANGQVFLCNKCKGVHLEFNNLSFNLPSKDFYEFASYFRRLDGGHWELVNCGSIFNRKIIVPVGHPHINMMLSKPELDELKRLLAVAVPRLKVDALTKIDFCDNLN